MRQPRLALAAAAALVGLGALGVAPAESADAPGPNEILAKSISFNPTPIGVKPDTEVTWTVAEAGPGGEGHLIRLNDPKADCDGDSDCKKKNEPEQAIGPGLSFRRTFEEPGEYAYYCAYHQRHGMTGVVFVNAEGTVPTTQPPATSPPPTQPPATSPPPTQPPATSPPPTAPRPAPEPAPTTTTTKAPKANAAGKAPKPATTQGPTTTTLPPETTTTQPPMVLPPLAEKGPLVQAPVVESTTTTLVPAEQSGEDGFVAVNKKPRRGGVKKATYAAVGALGLSLLGGGVVWWRRRPSRYWSA